jgi:hypothetical protein
MGISYTEAIENGLISETTRKLLPDRCKCGSNYELNDSLTGIECTNKNCIEYLVNRIENFTQLLSLQLSSDEIRELVKKLNLQTPYQLLMVDDAVAQNVFSGNGLDPAELAMIAKQVKETKSKEFTLTEIVKLCGITEVSKVAGKIFAGFETFDDAYSEIENKQVIFINERLGIRDTESTIFSADIYDKIIDLKDELIFAEMLLSTKKCDKQSLKIVFADNIQPYVNKSELMDFLNYTYGYNFILMSSVSEDTDILVRNDHSNNSNIKYRTAKLINNAQVAKEMNEGSLQLKDVEKKVKYELKPRGCKIYIDKLDYVLDKLDEIENKDKDQSVQA